MLTASFIQREFVENVLIAARQVPLPKGGMTKENASSMLMSKRGHLLTINSALMPMAAAFAR